MDSPIIDTIPDSLVSLESERVILAALLDPRDAEIHANIAELVAPGDYHAREHIHVARLIAMLRESLKSHDSASVLDLARSKRMEIGGARFLTNLISDPVKTAASHKSLVSAALRVKELAGKRALRRQLLQAAQDLEAQDLMSVIASVEDSCANERRAAETALTGPRHIAHFMHLVLESMQAASEGGQVLGVLPTSYQGLNDMLGGGLPTGNGIIVVAGRPAMGKTAIARAIQDGMALNGTPTLFFSTESPGTSIARRDIASVSRVPQNTIKRGDASDHQFTAMVEGIEALNGTESYIDDSPGLTKSMICARARSWLRRYPKGCVVIDYLQNVQQDPGRQLDEGEHVTSCSRAFTALAREFPHASVIVLSQLNRTVESRTNKRPIMSDLRQSGQIEQDASVIMFVYRDEVYNPDTKAPGITEGIIAKNREGGLGVVQWASNMACNAYVDATPLNDTY